MNPSSLSLHCRYHVTRVQPILECDEIIGCGVAGKLRHLCLGEPIGITDVHSSDEYCGAAFTEDLIILCDSCGGYKDALMFELSKYKKLTADAISYSTFSDVLDMGNHDEDSSDEIDLASLSEECTVQVQRAESAQLLKEDFVVIEEVEQNDTNGAQELRSFCGSVLNFAQENKKTLYCMASMALFGAGMFAFKHFSATSSENEA